MFTLLGKNILARWKQLDWMPPLPNLDRHLEHIAGGALVVLFFMACGLSWAVAALLSTLIFAIVEGTTAFFKKNYTDSAFDFMQYHFHWFLFFLYNAFWILAAIYLVVWVALYVYFLLEGW